MKVESTGKKSVVNGTISEIVISSTPSIVIVKEDGLSERFNILDNTDENIKVGFSTDSNFKAIDFEKDDKVYISGVKVSDELFQAKNVVIVDYSNFAHEKPQQSIQISTFYLNLI